MTYLLLLVLSVALPLLVLDIFWLTIMAPRLYYKHIGHLLASNPNWIPAIVFYIVYVFAISYFIVHPALSGNLLWYHVLLRGALLGLVAYATYDLTNHATMNNWSSLITIVDIIWGMVLTGTASLVGYVLMKWWG